MVRVPNDALREARRRTKSPCTPGESLSRPELADLVNAWVYERTKRVGAMTAGYVGKLERGVIRWPYQDYRDALRAVLAVDTDRELGFRRPTRTHADRWSTACHTPAPYGDSAAGNPGRPPEARLAGSLVAVPPSWLEVVDRSRFAVRRDAIDSQLVTALEQTATTLAGMYRGADPRATTTMAAALADQLLRLLDAGSGSGTGSCSSHGSDGGSSGGDRARLAAVTTGVHAQVGLWACHNDNPSLAYRHLATACQVAQGAGDPGLQARALGAFSYLFSSAPRGGRGGDPDRALVLLDQATALVPAGDSFTLAWLATWRADQLATLGELPQARADVETAAAALERPDPGPPGFFSRETYGYGIREHLGSVRGVVLALGEEMDEAERTFEAVLASAANLRRLVSTHGHTALARSRLRNPEGTCEALRRSVVAALRGHYPMGLRRVLGVRAGFDPRWADLPCVRELDDLLTTAVAGGTPGGDEPEPS